MYIYIYIYIHTYILIYLFIYLFIYYFFIFIFLYVCIYIYIHMLHTCNRLLRKPAYMYVCMYVYRCKCLESGPPRRRLKSQDLGCGVKGLGGVQRGTLAAQRAKANSLAFACTISRYLIASWSLQEPCRQSSASSIPRHLPLNPRFFLETAA